ncbi:glycosyltransferase family 4 protein [Patescibacteria group bacterium]
MKSLLFTIEFPPQKGGISTYYKNICEYLSAKKISVLTSQEANERDFDNEQRYKIYRKKLISTLPIWPKWISSFFHLWRTIKKEKIDIILVGQILPLGTVAYIYKKLFNLPYGVFIHGMDIQMAKQNKRKVKLCNTILNNAKFIIVNSNYTESLVLEQGIDENKIIVVYPCVSNSAQIDTNFKTKRHEKTLLTIGRLVKRKGHDMVIKTLPKIIKKFPKIEYIIAGDGPDKKYLENLAIEYQVDKYVKFLGKVSDSVRNNLLSECNIFIMPSREIKGDVEGFGIVYLEAGLYKKPVIAGKSGGVVEAVIDGQTGILVNPEDVNDIANAVIKILTNNTLANKFGVQGRERVLNKFTKEKQIGKIENLLK